MKFEGKIEAQTLKAEWQENWQAEDGTGLIHFRADREPYPGATKRTAGNDNGPLFRIIADALFKKRGVLVWKDWLNTQEMLNAIRLEPGIYARNPNRRDLEALDDYCAIVSAQVITTGRFSWVAEDVVSHGVQTGYTFNTGSPKDFMLRAWKQGSDVCHYKLARGFMPTLWELLWFWLGLVVNAFQPVPPRCSEWQMSWLRVLTIEALWKHRLNDFRDSWKWIFPVMFSAILFWKIMLLAKTKGKGIEEVIRIYYGGRKPENPLVELAKGVRF